MTFHKNLLLANAAVKPNKGEQSDTGNSYDLRDRGLIDLEAQEARDEQEMKCAPFVDSNISVGFWISDASHSAGKELHVADLHAFARLR
jgi:hypothetical protein